MKTLWMIGGTMGVGKTAVSRQLEKDLADSVFLDGDWCWDSSPFQVTDETKKMVMENICFLLNGFLSCSAYQNVIFCWVMHEQAIVDEILSRLCTSGCRVHCISLTADEQTLRRRLEEDVTGGIRTADVIARSIERLPLYDRLQTVRIDTSGKTVKEIADEIAALQMQESADDR